MCRQKLYSMPKIKFLNKDQEKVRTRKTSTCVFGLKKQSELHCKSSTRGTAGYELLRSSYLLSLNRSRKVEAMENIQKDWVVFMNEMEIAQGYEHDRSLDSLFGSTTLLDTPDEIANHPLVFMVGGAANVTNK